jgi:hypothetical protein
MYTIVSSMGDQIPVVRQRGKSSVVGDLALDGAGRAGNEDCVALSNQGALALLVMSRSLT